MSTELNQKSLFRLILIYFAKALLEADLFANAICRQDNLTGTDYIIVAFYSSTH